MAAYFFKVLSGYMSNLYILGGGILLALFLTAIFSGLEIAFYNASRLSIELKKKQGKKSGIILSRLTENPSSFLGSTLVGFNIFLAAYGLLVSTLIKTSFWIPIVHLENPYLKLAFDTLVSSLIIIWFGEFFPKAIFKARSESLLSAFAGFSSFFHDLFAPIAAALVNVSDNLLKYLFNVRMRHTNEPFNMVDLEHFLQQTNEQDEVSQELNKTLLQNALSLPGIRIRQCLVPRTEIEAIDIHVDIETTRKKFETTKLSKIIVYEGNIDNIQGYIHQLDLFKRPASIKDILLPIPVVPESMSATDLINKFGKERKTIAWVVDEFGGTSGIITMEDILEELFGDIKDEYDDEEFVEKQISENEYIFSGRLELDYLNDKFDLEFPPSESETLSGYIINAHETIPRPKERIIIDKYEFDVLNVSDTRIEMVKMKILR